jgi:hypothetical protein
VQNVFASNQDVGPVERCSAGGCNLTLCEKCGTEHCDECCKAICPDHLWLKACMNKESPDEFFIYPECQVEASSRCKNYRSTFCTYCIGEHECQKTGSDCGNMWDF